MRHQAALLVAVLAFAGCLGPVSGLKDLTVAPLPNVADWALRALPAEADHNHNESSEHVGLSSPNFATLGWDPLSREAGMGGGGCGAAVSTPGRRLAVTTATWAHARGAAILDVTDPIHPEHLADIASDQFWFRDAEITPDGKYAVLASFPLAKPAVPVVASTPVRAASACASFVPPPAMAYVGGVVLVDLADPARPRLSDFAPDPVAGPHSVYTNTVDGVTYVIATYDGVPSDASRFWFYTVQNGQLLPYGIHTLQSPRGTPPSLPLSNLHTDAWIQKHPKTGQLLAYLANWDSGLVILRMDGPGRLVQIGGWNNYDPAQGNEMTGQVHSVRPIPDLWDGKHYLFVGQELIARPANRPTGQVVMFDSTDPASLKPVARWTLPVDPGKWDTKTTWCCLFSTHYMTLVDHTLFIAMYHGGVWAIDARPSAGPELPSLGAFIPSPPLDAPPTPDPVGPAPMVEEVYSIDGYTLVTFDDHGGVYTFRFDPTLVLPAPTPWTADSWIH